MKMLLDASKEVLWKNPYCDDSATAKQQGFQVRKGKSMSDYRQLKVAVQDLLEELRISPACLETMANGYSPDYPGANVNKNREWKNPYCKVQLSMVVAQKLIGAGIIHLEKTQTPAVKKIMSWYDVLPPKKQDMVVERLHELMVEFTTQVTCVEELVHNVVNHHGVADTQRLLQEAVRGE